MKFIFHSALLAGLFLMAQQVHAQVVTFVGMTSGSQMSGSANDWIFFNTGNFTGGTNTPGAPGENLTSFSMSGGIQADNVDVDSITPPGGSAPIETGELGANGGIAFQLVLGTDPSSSGSALNSNFNYNDFDVWIMYSNTQQSAGTDNNISLTPYYPDDGSEPDDSSAYWGTNTVDVNDNNTTAGTAYFLEFQVTGMEAASLAAGTPIDLALTANYESDGSAESGTSYIGGVSFESVPEPTTWALVGVGGLVLAWRVRRHLVTA